MLHRLSQLLFIAAVGLTAAGGWSAWRNSGSPAPEPSFVTELSNADIGRVGHGPHEVTVRVTNPAGRTRHVLGMMAGCRPNCCFHTGEDGPLAVPAGGTVLYRGVLDVNGSGPFEVPIVLYLEEIPIRHVNLTQRGVSVAPEGRANAPG